MPSCAYNTFKTNIKQVDKLLEAFVEMRSPTRGRKHLDHFTRAALIFLCSSWEVYIEQVANEAGKIISQRCTIPSSLPPTVQKELSKIVKHSKHDLSPIQFADEWKEFYLKEILNYTSMLNTPKKHKILELFNKYLGISGDRIIRDVPTLSQINAIVETRGKIAHNVYAEQYLKKDTVVRYYDIIYRAVIEIEILLWHYIPEVTDQKRPWRNTY